MIVVCTYSTRIRENCSTNSSPCTVLVSYSSTIIQYLRCWLLVTFCTKCMREIHRTKCMREIPHTKCMREIHQSFDRTYITILDLDFQMILEYFMVPRTFARLQYSTVLASREPSRVQYSTVREKRREMAMAELGRTGSRNIDSRAEGGRLSPLCCQSVGQSVVGQSVVHPSNLVMSSRLIPPCHCVWYLQCSSERT